MGEPRDRDPEAGQSGSPDSDGSGDGRSEDDLDIGILASVWRDDLLLDAIGGASTADGRLDVPFDVSEDRQLVEALLSWRRDVESDPIAPAAPDPVRRAGMESAAGYSRHRGFPVPLASALAAVVMIVLTATAAYGAAPNDVLWPVTEVLYSQHAESVRAAHDVAAAQARARVAMTSGHLQGADAALHAAASRLPRVRSEDGRTELQNQQRDLARQLDSRSGGAAGTGTSPHNSGAVAAPSPTSQPSSHLSVPEGTAARTPLEAQDSTSHPRPAAAGPTQPTPQPTSATSTTLQHPEQSGEPPRPSRATATAPSTSAAPIDASAPQPGGPVQAVRPSKTVSSQLNAQPSEAGPTTTGSARARAVEPSSSVRKTNSQHAQAASGQATSAAPTPEVRNSPSSPNKVDPSSSVQKNKNQPQATSRQSRSPAPARKSHASPSSQNVPS